MHYLESRPDADGFEFQPRGHDCPTRADQFIFVALIVLEALTSFMNYALEHDSSAALAGLFDSTREKLMSLYREAVQVEDAKRDAG
jgi:hypothetical protein